MRQRDSIAHAFAVSPDILLRDEPFTALDEKTARDLRAEFVKLARLNNKTAVFIIHQIHELMEIGDHVLVFRHSARTAYEVHLKGEQGPVARQDINDKVMQVLAIDRIPATA